MRESVINWPHLWTTVGGGPKSRKLCGRGRTCGWPLRGGTNKVLLLVTQLCVLLQISRSSSGRPEYAGSCSIPILVSAAYSKNVDIFSIQTIKGRIDLRCNIPSSYAFQCDSTTAFKRRTSTTSCSTCEYSSVKKYRDQLKLVHRVW